MRHGTMRTGAAVVAAVWSAALGQAQSPLGAKSGQHTDGREGSFRLVETSVDQVHAAYKSGALTAHRLVQAYLDRIDAYDKKGPTINYIITINPRALAEADTLDAAFKKSGTFVGSLQHSDRCQRRDRHGRHANHRRHPGVQGLPPDQRRLRR
jgi:hypothetical protein